MSETFRETYQKHKPTINLLMIFSSIILIFFTLFISVLQIESWLNTRDMSSNLLSFSHDASQDHDDIIASIAKRHGIDGWVDASKDRAFWQYTIFTRPKELPPPSSTRLDADEKLVLFLSERIAQTRSNLERLTPFDGLIANWVQVATVALSWLASLAVALKAPESNDETKKRRYWLKNLAIILTTFTAAATSLNSYFAPQEVYTRDQNALSALGQLHDEMTFEMHSLSSSSDKIDMKNVRDWQTRFLTITNQPSQSKKTSGDNPNNGAEKSVTH